MEFNVFNKSLFKKDAFMEAIGDSKNNGYSVIRITPQDARAGSGEKDPAIIGVIKNNISFSIESNWTDLGNIGSTIFPSGSSTVKNFMDKGNSVANVLGFSDLTASFASKLIYQQSGRLSISPQMRIVDWNGTGQPIFSSLLLAAYCLPRTYFSPSSEETKKTMEWLTEEGKRIYNEMKAKQSDTGQKMIGAIENTAEAIAEGVEEGIKLVGSFVDKTMGDGYSKRLLDESVDGLDDLFSLRSSPSPVTIEVGKYFKRTDMVIENVNFEFSKEVTENGPLYVDIDITLKSRKILTDLEQVGLKSPNSKEFSRVNIIDIIKSGENAF
jgi:hypothetical protein